MTDEGERIQDLSERIRADIDRGLLLDVIDTIEPCQLEQFEFKPDTRHKMERALDEIAKELEPALSPSKWPNCPGFHDKVAQKPTVWKLDLSVGEVEQARSSATLRYKAGAEASGAAYEFGLGEKSIGLVLVLKGSDETDSFRMGELSSTIKMLCEESFTSPVSSLTCNVQSDFAGNKTLQIILELKYEALFEVVRKIFEVSEASKFEAELQFSEKPSRNSAAQEFLFAHLTIDTEFKRVFHSLIEKLNYSQFASQDNKLFTTFFSAMKKFSFTLEVDSWAEFWECLFTSQAETQPPEELRRLGWHSVAHFVKDYFKTKQNEAFTSFYRPTVENLSGINAAYFICGHQHAFELKAENLDFVNLFPTFSGFEEMQKTYVGYQTLEHI